MNKNNRKEAKIICFNSQKPGVGKSFITKEVTALLAKASSDSDILIVDVDTQNFSIGNAFGIQDSAMNNFNISIVLNNTALLDGRLNDFDINEFKNSLYKYDKDKVTSSILNRVRILPMKCNTLSERYKLSKKAYLDLLNIIKYEYDYILIDTNSNFVTEGLTVASFEAADVIFQITSNDKNSIDATLHYMKELRDLDKNIFDKCMLVYNQVPENFIYEESKIIYQNNLKTFYELFNKKRVFKVAFINHEEMNLGLEYCSYLSLRTYTKKKIFHKDKIMPYYGLFYKDILALVSYIKQSNKNINGGK